jgi:ClpP class serine protease
MGEKEIELLTDARIMSADDALKLKLIDGIGTWSSAIERLEKRFGQGKMKVVAYTRYPDDVRTLYSRTYGLASPLPAFGSSGASAVAAAGSVLEALSQGAATERPLTKGFYYLW